ncbi:MAG: hypothetical protein U0794_15160 [Isosphaeraceae bacterium]
MRACEWRWIGGLVAVLIASTHLTGVVAADDAPRKASEPGSEVRLPVNRMVGNRISDFTLTDVATGKHVRLYGYRVNRAVVLAFL